MLFAGDIHTYSCCHAVLKSGHWPSRQVETPPWWPPSHEMRVSSYTCNLRYLCRLQKDCIPPPPPNSPPFLMMSSGLHPEMAVGREELGQAGAHCSRCPCSAVSLLAAVKCGLREVNRYVWYDTEKRTRGSIAAERRLLLLHQCRLLEGNKPRAFVGPVLLSALCTAVWCSSSRALPLPACALAQLIWITVFSSR